MRLEDTLKAPRLSAIGGADHIHRLGTCTVGHAAVTVMVAPRTLRGRVDAAATLRSHPWRCDQTISRRFYPRPMEHRRESLHTEQAKHLIGLRSGQLILEYSTIEARQPLGVEAQAVQKNAPCHWRQHIERRALLRVRRHISVEVA